MFAFLSFFPFPFLLELGGRQYTGLAARGRDQYPGAFRAGYVVVGGEEPSRRLGNDIEDCKSIVGLWLWIGFAYRNSQKEVNGESGCGSAMMITASRSHEITSSHDLSIQGCAVFSLPRRLGIISKSRPIQKKKLKTAIYRYIIITPLKARPSRHRHRHRTRRWQTACGQRRPLQAGCRCLPA